MSAATVRVLPRPGGRRTVVVDCKHGTTTVDVFPSARVDPADRLVIALALERHQAEEGCRCTRALRLKYLTARLA